MTLRRRRRSLAGFVLFALLGVAPSARADVTLAPSADGYLGAWLGVPLDREVIDAGGLRPAAGSALSDSLRFRTWSVVDGGPDSFDLNRAFGARRAKRILLGSLLVLDAPLDGLFLVAVDGSASLTVDGAVLWSRPAPHARGRACDPVPVSLRAGGHVVVLDLGRSGPAWNLDVRLLARSNLEPPEAAVWRLPGATPADAARLLSHLVRVETSAGLVPFGYQPRVRIDFPRGAPIDAAAPMAAMLTHDQQPTGTPVELGRVAASHGTLDAVERTLPAVGASELTNARSTPNGVTATIGSVSKKSRLTLDSRAPALFARSEAVASALRLGRVESSDRDVAVATIERTLAELGGRLDAGDPAAELVLRRLESFVAAYESGADPLRTAGVLDLAKRSPVDGAPQALELHVPASYRPNGATRYPLVVLLHGYDGTPERIMTAFFGTDSKRPRPGVDGFVLAPAAHGNAFYRGPGETEVVDAIDWVVTHYPVDPDRISIAGHSMGGTGAAEIGLHYANRFSSIASLAGYHSYFVRRDVQGRPLRAWEWAELVRYSPASFAENGRDIPLYVAQGTHDLPMIHSEVLVDRYRALGYSVAAEWPEIGHDVWRIVWDAGKGWPALATRRRARSPKAVTLKTDSLRYPNRGWVTIVALEHPPFPGTVDAKVVAPDRIAVRAHGVSALHLERPAPHVAPGSAVTVVVNGTELAFSGTEDLDAHLGRNGWERGFAAAPGLSKHAGLEGPIRDAYAGSLLFVYGTLDPSQTRAAREVAEHFRARYSGDARFDVLADVAVTPSLLRSRSLFLVGSSASNAVLRDLDRSLPFGVTNGGVRLGQKVVTGDAELGVAGIYPNPLNPVFYAVVVEASNARGLYRAMSLPLELPDFVVFDSGVAPAAGQQVLGEARVLGAGYFDATWALPADTADVIVVPAGHDGARWTPG